MPLFNLSIDKVKRISEINFKLEKEIQDLTENNLKEIFNLILVKSEFQLNNLRIDTLAFDIENNSFVIIEYKKNENKSVIDQGYAYLSLMLNNKAEFILAYLDNCNKDLDRSKIDWSQSRVIFISPSFSKYQKQAINFKDLPFELYEISKYENNLIQFEQLKPFDNSESIKKISKENSDVKKVNSEVKVYLEEDHLDKSSEKIKYLYKELKSQILNIDDNIEIIPKKMYLAFKLKTNIADFVFKKNKIKIHLNLKKGDVKINNLILRDVSTIGHWGNGDYEIEFSKIEDLPFVLSLIKRSYDKNR